MAGEKPRSVCPVCLRAIPAHHESQGGNTYLVKECPKHGLFRTVVWRGEPDMNKWSREKIPSRPKTPMASVQDGCPFDCGLCPEHRQHTCTAIIEITWRCDLGCPVCFASAGVHTPPDPTVDEIGTLLDRVMEASGPCNIQFSGGEPSVRENLPELIALAKEKGFLFVQLNTNGLRAAREIDFARRLSEAGLDSVFLQFDGTEDSIHQILRGRPLVEEKYLAVERFSEAGIGVVLVPTVVPGVNDHNLGGIIDFAVSNSPGVRGVHFQPVSYFGRYPDHPTDDQRITLPEVMSRLEEQTGGAIGLDDFLPPGCEHSRCSFHANYLVTEQGELKRMSARRTACNCSPQLAEEGANKAKSFVRRQWAVPEERPLIAHKPLDDLDRFLARAATHALAVSGMAFQDAWTLDLERLRGCCIHVVSPEGRLVPFCAYNLTAANGRTLYRRTFLESPAP